MIEKSPWAALALALVGFALPVTGARAFDDAQYPEMRGSWSRPGAAHWDLSKPVMRQEAPLTPEYQAVFAANVANTLSGGQETNPQVICYPSGMPRVMIAYEPFEIIITPEITYVRFDQLGETRRIYTDGRGWPEKIRPSWDGTSIGKWVEPDAQGRYRALEVETRGIKGPRLIDQTGIPVHDDNQTVVKERLYLDPTNRNRLYDEITTFDHALTRPWTVTRPYAREAKQMWVETNCVAENKYVVVGKETYFISLDGFLMPTKKDQPAPDLKFFR
jgi:hypothetical protein